MKNILILLLLALCSYGKGQDLSDTIRWENSPYGKLQISDFKHAPDKHSTFAAMSYITRPVEWHTKKDTLYIDMVCAFLRSKSWFNQEKGDRAKNGILLSHEQGHFDITELEVRRTKKWIIDHAGLFTKKNFSTLLTKYFDELTDHVEERNNRYDKETRFSTDEAMQKKWSADIAAELKELEMYEDDIVMVVLKR